MHIGYSLNGCLFVFSVNSVVIKILRRSCANSIGVTAGAENCQTLFFIMVEGHIAKTDDK